jgi:hypothetical protein
VWIVVATIDNDEVFDPPRQVQLAVDIDTEVTGGQPAAVVRDARGTAPSVEPGLEFVAEYPPRFILAAEVSARNVVARPPRSTAAARSAPASE